MKRLLSTFLLALPLVAGAQTTITVNTDRVTGQIDPNIYGVFMEPIGRDQEPPIENNLYGPLYCPGTPQANEDGFNTVYIDAFRELRIPAMRWPGGNYVAGYNWQDGIGPKSERPVRKDLAWGGYETNQVGTDEWVALNRAIGSENIICLNLGLGDINSARFWCEYTNVDHGTYYSDLRAKYGHREPYNVKYWGLGNEVDGYPWIMGHKDIDDYVKVAKEAAKALRAVDRRVQFIANGSAYYPDGTWTEWNRKVVEGLTGIAQYISIHRYWRDGLDESRADDWDSYVGEAAFDFEEKITSVQAQVNIVKALHPEKRPMMLSVDEWGAHGGANMKSVLACAMCLNSFVRHADFVKMGAFTMATSLLNSDRESGQLYKGPLFYAFKLFSNNCRGESFDTYVSGDTFASGPYSGIPYLDATAATSEDGKTLYVTVVNRHHDDAIKAEIQNVGRAKFATGKVTVNAIEGGADETFTYADRGKYGWKEGNATVTKDGKVTYTFPAHSITQIAVPLNL